MIHYLNSAIAKDCLKDGRREEGDNCQTNCQAGCDIQIILILYQIE